MFDFALSEDDMRRIGALNRAASVSPTRRARAGMGCVELGVRQSRCPSRPKYFMYFPGNYRWSAAFVNMLGTPQSPGCRYE